MSLFNRTKWFQKIRSCTIKMLLCHAHVSVIGDWFSVLIAGASKHRAPSAAGTEKSRDKGLKSVGEWGKDRLHRGFINRWLSNKFGVVGFFSEYLENESSHLRAVCSGTFRREVRCWQAGGKRKKEKNNKTKNLEITIQLTSVPD